VGSVGAVVLSVLVDAGIEVPLLLGAVDGVPFMLAVPVLGAAVWVELVDAGACPAAV
jgi:hypothetical protein